MSGKRQKSDAQIRVPRVREGAAANGPSAQPPSHLIHHQTGCLFLSFSAINQLTSEFVFGAGVQASQRTGELYPSSEAPDLRKTKLCKFKSGHCKAQKRPRVGFLDANGDLAQSLPRFGHLTCGSARPLVQDALSQPKMV